MVRLRRKRTPPPGARGSNLSLNLLKVNTRGRALLATDWLRVAEKPQAFAFWFPPLGQLAQAMCLRRRMREVKEALEVNRVLFGHRREDTLCHHMEDSKRGSRAGSSDLGVEAGGKRSHNTGD